MPNAILISIALLTNMVELTFPVEGRADTGKDYLYRLTSVASLASNAPRVAQTFEPQWSGVITNRRPVAEGARFWFVERLEYKEP